MPSLGCQFIRKNPRVLRFHIADGEFAVFIINHGVTFLLMSVKRRGSERPENGRQPWLGLFRPTVLLFVVSYR